MPVYAQCRWLLIPVMAAHNAEEWFMLPRYGSIAPTLEAHIRSGIAPPSFASLQVSWLIVTLVPALVVVAAARAGRSRFLDGLVCCVASMYLANVFLPHVLESAMDLAYSPGLATAALVVLPFAILLLRQAYREQYLSGRQLAAAVISAILALPLVLAATLAFSNALVGALAT